jgi:hypothetical protein
MHSPSTQVSEESLHEGYEVSDIHTGVISGCLVALAIIMISALFAIIIIIRGFDGGRAPLNNTEASPLQAHDVFAPGAPQLQQDPVADKRAFVGAMKAKVESYGWVSQEPGQERAHIPVSRAIELLATGKVPYRQQPQVALEAPAPSAPATQPEGAPVAAQ